jgi:hypothetical protein
VTKNGILSAKALKRIFKDGVQPKKLPKRQKIVKAEPTKAPEKKMKKLWSQTLQELQKRSLTSEDGLT